MKSKIALKTLYRSPVNGADLYSPCGGDLCAFFAGAGVCGGIPRDRARRGRVYRHRLS